MARTVTKSSKVKKYQWTKKLLLLEKLKRDYFLSCLWNHLTYYDVNTGYLVRTESTEDVQGQSITSTNEYSNYKEVSGVMIPSTMKIINGPQVIILETAEIKVNEGVTGADFD